MSADGRWNVIIDSPLGKQEGVFALATDGGTLTGTSTDGRTTVNIENGTVAGDQLKFTIRVKQPIPLKLQFDLTMAGDSLSGTVKAGVFGRQKVTAQRAA